MEELISRQRELDQHNEQDSTNSELDPLTLLSSDRFNQIGYSNNNSDPLTDGLVRFNRVAFGLGLSSLFGAISKERDYNEALCALNDKDPTLHVYSNNKLTRQYVDAYTDVKNLKSQIDAETKSALQAELHVKFAEIEARSVRHSYEGFRGTIREFTLTDSHLELFRKQRAFLTGEQLLGMNGRPIEADKFIGSVDEVRDSTKLFSEGSQEANMLRGLERTQTAKIIAANTLEQTNKELALKSAELNRLKIKITDSVSRKWEVRSALGSGVAISGACMLAGHVIDSSLGSDAPINSTLRVGIDGFVVPAVLMSHAIPKPQKFAIASALFTASRIAGYFEL